MLYYGPIIQGIPDTGHDDSHINLIMHQSRPTLATREP